MNHRLNFASVFALLALTAALPAQTALKMGVGTHLANYQKANLELALGLNTMLSPNDLEFELASAVAIDLDSSTGTVVPTFLVPVTLGLNFLYPLNYDKTDRLPRVFSWTYFFGLGVAPQASFGLDFADPQYFGGPYFKTGFRFKAHNYMTLQLHAQQDLLFGGPAWISTSTRAGIDILFSFPPSKTMGPLAPPYVDAIRP